MSLRILDPQVVLRVFGHLRVYYDLYIAPFRITLNPINPVGLEGFRALGFLFWAFIGLGILGRINSDSNLAWNACSHKVYQEPQPFGLKGFCAGTR